MTRSFFGSPAFASVIVVALLLPAGSLADELAAPSAWIADGWVHGSMLTNAAPARIAAILNSPGEVARIDGGTTEIKVVARSGSCVDLDYGFPTIMGKMTAQVRTCNDGSAWTSSLITSDSFKEYATEWRIAATPQGSKVLYKVRTIPNMRVPESLVLGQSKKAVAKMLTNLQNELRD